LGGYFDVNPQHYVTLTRPLGLIPLGGKVLKERNTRMCVYLDQNKPIKGGFSIKYEGWIII
jgi:hypothetical protein